MKISDSYLDSILNYQEHEAEWIDPEAEADEDYNDNDDLIQGE
jgi:hypothetical protein